MANERGVEAKELITSFEQHGMKRVCAEGLETVTLRLLTRKFGTLPEGVSNSKLFDSIGIQ